MNLLAHMQHMFAGSDQEEYWRGGEGGERKPATEGGRAKSYLEAGVHPTIHLK